MMLNIFVIMSKFTILYFIYFFLYRYIFFFFFFFFSSRRRHTRYWRDWSSDVCSSDLPLLVYHVVPRLTQAAIRYVGIPDYSWRQIPFVPWDTLGVPKDNISLLNEIDRKSVV